MYYRQGWVLIKRQVGDGSYEEDPKMSSSRALAMGSRQGTPGATADQGGMGGSNSIPGVE